jgi:hypothetical protein
LKNQKQGGKMKTYKIIWVKHITRTAVSEVEANSKEEAKQKAEEGKDKNFKILADDYRDFSAWVVDEIKEPADEIKEKKK